MSVRPRNEWESKIAFYSVKGRQGGGLVGGARYGFRPAPPACRDLPLRVGVHGPVHVVHYLARQPNVGIEPTRHFVLTLIPT